MRRFLIAPLILLAAFSAAASESSLLTIKAPPGFTVKAFATYVASRNLWAPYCQDFGPFQLYGGRASKTEPIAVVEASDGMKISVPNLESDFCGSAFAGAASLSLILIENGEQVNTQIEVFAGADGTPSTAVSHCGLEKNALGNLIFTCTSPGLGFKNNAAELTISLDGANN